MILLTIVELRDTIVVACTILQECLSCGLIGLIYFWQGLSIGVRGQRIHHQHSRQQRAVLIVRRYLTHVVLLHLVRCTNLQPIFYLILSIDGGCQTLISVCIALYDTIIIQV